VKKLALVGLTVVGVSAAFWFLAHEARGPDGRGAAAVSARPVLYYRDPMHPSYTSDRPGKAPDCGMDLEPVYAAAEEPTPSADPTGSPGAVLVSGERQRMLGVRLGRVETSRTQGTLRALGRVALDENRVFPVRTGCDGWVSRIYPGATTGSAVRKGQPLASVYGRDYTTAQRSFLYALRASENPPPVLPGDDTNQPTLTLREARLFLQNLGIGDAQIEQLAQTRQVILDVLLTSPSAGVIVARNAFPKQRFDRDVELFRIADLSHVWIIADLVGDEQAAVLPGATARVSLAGRPGPGLQAKVSEALSRFDGASRALKLRLDADNPRLVLRPDMFVDLEFSISLPEAATVPAEAIVESGLGQTVYVERGEGVFEPRRVETGWRFAGRVQIVGGLPPDATIVVSGNALLDSQSRMRHGDAGVHD
jgi:multidrug efflux pump subunit AcrA (membrane-fusion protein)